MVKKNVYLLLAYINDSGMKKIFTLLMISFIAIQLHAQLNKEVNELSRWYTQSEQIRIPDSISMVIHQECQRKNIPFQSEQKSLTHFRVICNTALPLAARIKIAQRVIENYSDYEAHFPLTVLIDLKKELLTQIK